MQNAEYRKKRATQKMPILCRFPTNRSKLSKKRLSEPAWRRLIRPAILILIIWLGFALRLHELASVPLRGDEAFSALNWADTPLPQSLTEIATLEPHPPLTYGLFRLWRLLIGGIDSPFSLAPAPGLGQFDRCPCRIRLGLPPFKKANWRPCRRACLGHSSLRNLA